ncbi:MAG: hypothetical protein ACSLE9_07825 [Burkholderiaceae bacterium]
MAVTNEVELLPDGTRRYRGRVLKFTTVNDLAAVCARIDAELDGIPPRGSGSYADDRLAHHDYWQELRTLKSANEDELLTRVVDLLDTYNWLCHHDRPARMADGTWRTAVQGDAGFPDIIALRGGRMVIAELKHATKVSADQELWLEAFRQLPGAEVYVWRPGDEDAIEEVLR